MARKNAAETLARQLGRSGRETAALDELARLLGLSEPPARIECYDISHTAGSETVAGMVVYADGKPKKSDYRLFRLRTVADGDDYASMREVLSRRIAEYDACRETGEGFGARPDLVLLDGGEEHVRAVLPLFEAAGWTVPLYGLVKDDKHRTRAIAADGGEIAVRSHRACFTLLSSIQEEVHRLAIGYHRRTRSRRHIRTTLTDIPGIGETRARELLRVFGSVKAVSRATEEQLLTVRGMTHPAAQNVLRYFAGTPDQE
jgi:excinuclease ABC subunit C